MFLPENQKKLMNICIVSLKKYGQRYELALFPNKLYDYRNKITSNHLEVLQTIEIFTSVSKGRLCSEKDLKLFNKPKNEIIDEILAYGFEQKNVKTRNYELDMKEKEIVTILHQKIMKDGKFISFSILKEIIAKFQIDMRDSKVQSLEIAKELVRKGYEKVTMRIQITGGELNKEIKSKFEISDMKQGICNISSEDYPEFKKECLMLGIRHRIVQDLEVEDEFIC